jgi:transposase
MEATIVRLVADNVFWCCDKSKGCYRNFWPRWGHRLLDLSTVERARLQQLARARTLAARIVVRSRIVLLLADGVVPNDVARRLSISPATVRLWYARFLQLGADGLLREAPGRGRRPALDYNARQMLLTDEGRPVRALAAILGVSAATISRWRKRLRATIDS